MLTELKNKKLRFFLLQSNDTGLFLLSEFYFGYLLNLMVDKLGFPLHNFAVEIVYPFQKYLDYILREIKNYQEDYFVFYYENSYHSNNYGYGFYDKLMEVMSQQGKQNRVIIYSMKISAQEAKDLMNKYGFIECVVMTDIEYFFYELYEKNTPIESIPNIIYKSETQQIVETSREIVDYPLEKYLIGSHYSGYLSNYRKSKDFIINLLDEDSDKTDELITYLWPKNKKIESFRYSAEVLAMISTGRGCKYNCSYCYRGKKYSQVRQIPLSIIKKDLDYLESMYYEDIYVYDDCFLTTNKDRLKEIIDLLSSYHFYYGLSVRYEMCNSDTFEQLSRLNLYRVQIGLQSISLSTNRETGRGINLEKFAQVVKEFRKRGVVVSIDLILGLPGENLQDFIKSVNFAVSLDPGSIHINTLFLNPGTNLYQNQEKYGIVVKNTKSFFGVPQIQSSDSFSESDIAIAKKYVEKIAKKITTTNIILR